MGTNAAISPAQLQHLQIAFRQLGYTGVRDRPDRLAAASDALGLDEPLRSFSDLSAGQFGTLMACLRHDEVPGGDARPASRIPDPEGVIVREGLTIAGPPPVTGSWLPSAPAEVQLMTLRDLSAAAAAWYVVFAILRRLEIGRREDGKA